MNPDSMYHSTSSLTTADRTEGAVPRTHVAEDHKDGGAS